jgi:hypothetical protein
MESLRRINVAEVPKMYLFEVARRARGPLYIVWEKRDVFPNEDLPSISFECEWHSKHAKAIDALGEALPVTLRSN